MKHFGCLKPELIENYKVKKIASFLIKNKLYQKAVKKIHYFSNDFPDNFIIEQGLGDYHLNDIQGKNTTIESGQLFFLTLFEFMKLLSTHLKNDLYPYLYIGEKNKIDLNNLLINEGKNIKLEPTKILLDDFYESIIICYRLKIIDIKFIFFENFNEEIFGLDFNTQKSIALKHYKKIYKSIFEDNITYMPDDDYGSYDFENDFLKVENKLKIVACNKIKYQHKLATINPFFEYLTGDKSIFTKAFYKKNVIVIEDTLKYEAKKMIMIELNNKFKFEEDFYFTNQNEARKTIKNFIPTTNEVKFSNSENNATPFINFLRHENKIEIEQIIKTHYSDLKGVSLRYLIEFLIDKQILLLNYGDKTKIHKSLKTLFNDKDIGTTSSIFDLKIDREKDHKYLNAKNNFLNKFEKLF
nr:hypothetical protein [uncultured Flavobacterium sp.]